MNKNAKRIAVITDSTCDIPPDLLEKHQIITVPLYLVWGMEDLRDGVDIDNATFYARLPKDPAHPKTSQPTPADFVKAIQECGAEEVVAVVLSDKLSGTLDSVLQAGKMVDVPVHAVDSSSVSMGLGWQVLAAARVRDQGGSVEDMIAAAAHVRKSLSVLFMVDTLEYLHRGGRIGGAAKFLGTALQLKPMLSIDTASGTVEAVERTRTRKKAIRRVIEATFERVDPTKPLHIGVLHAAAEDDARAVLKEVEATYKPVDVMFGQITPVLGVHGGPGLVGIGAYND